MIFIKKLEKRIDKTHSRVCIGLDPDFDKFPLHLAKNSDGLFEFLSEIIIHTHEFAAAYKLNIAFFEVLGSVGWQLIEKILKLIPTDIITIADAKRGDIGNTAKMYAKTFFETFLFDSITVNPYMGMDTLSPFIEYKDKGVIVLVRTSNKGSGDIQELKINNTTVYEHVAEKVDQLNSKTHNCLMVVGATTGDSIRLIRDRAPSVYFLVPGIGAQGGSLEDVINYAGKKVLINSSRQIIYASNQLNYAEKAAEEAKRCRDQINQLLELQ